jgi:FkbM family methyltransferase
LSSADRTYRMRSGLRLAAHDWIDTATIGVIFLRKDYGEIRDHSVVIDVGANIGVFSVYAAATSAHTMVYAYEPIPKNFDTLLYNRKLNSLEERIVPFACGIAGARGKHTFYFADYNTGHTLFPSRKGEYGIEIECIRLQDVFDENGIGICHLLKMDCEGAEFESLYSTPDEYFQRIEEIRLEYHCDLAGFSPNNCPADLVGFLESKSFRVTRLVPELNGRGMLWAKR